MQWRGELPRNYGQGVRALSVLCGISDLNKEERTEQTERDEDEKLGENQKSSPAELIDDQN